MVVHGDYLCIIARYLWEEGRGGGHQQWRGGELVNGGGRGISKWGREGG